MVSTALEKDSIRKVAFDYINSAYPLNLSSNYSGPKNISFGENKVQRDNYNKRVRAGMSDEAALRKLVSEKEEVELSDVEYARLLLRYINITMPGKEEESSQMDLRDNMDETFFRLVSAGYSVRDIFKYVVADVELPTFVVVSPIQKIKSGK